MFYTPKLSKYIRFIVFISCISFQFQTAQAGSVKDSLYSMFKSSPDISAKAEIALQLASEYTNRTNYDSSEYYLDYAYQSFININDERNIMNCYMQYGILESYKGNYTLAANYLLRTLIYAEKANNSSIYSIVYLNLASVYSALEEYKKAKYYLLKIDAQELKQNILLNINYLGNIGQLEYELGNFESALDYLNKGIALLGDNKQDVTLIQFYIIAGDCAYELKNVDLALSYYNKANLNIDKTVLPLQYAHLTHGLAKLFKNSNTQLALNYVNNSMEYAKLHQIPDLIVDNYLLQSEIYENQGKAGIALQLLKKYQSAKDSLRIDEVNKNIEVLESNYELEKSKSYIEKLQLINEKNILKNLIYLIFVIITILTSFLLFILLKNRNKINKELKRANIVKDKLLSIVSHDLKSPLNNILAVLDGIAKDDYSKEELEVILSGLNNQTLATVDTLDNILQWGKAQLRGISVQKTELNIESHLNYSIDLHRAQLINKSIQIEKRGEIKSIIQFDKDHLDFILRNLISNAIKFSYANSKIIVDVTKTEEFVSISVIDQGIGLQAAELSSIFSSLPSIKTGTSNEKGTGLALSLSKEFADINNAEIGYMANVPNGSVFYLKVFVNK